jgi:16S rRNA (cytosine1402-N4)-methyltransferase
MSDICPGCGKPNSCAIAAGQPAETCWCFKLARTFRLKPGASCFCSECLSLRASGQPGEKTFRRRPRYSGTHPRRFHEKYKELDPERYPEAAEKIAASGKTPAGTHRPILVDEILSVINPRPGQTGVDATLGYGGHAQAILERIVPGGHLHAFDVDPVELPKTETRLRALGYSEKDFTAYRRNFAGFHRALAERGVEGLDFVVADLGVSSMQMDDPSRGFTFKDSGPLDLRMNPNRGRPASDILAALDAAKLQRIFEENADEPRAARLADAIVAARESGPLKTTVQLADLIKATLRESGRRIEPDEMRATQQRVFQALRIEVNDEFSALDAFLRSLPACLKPGGRAAILTFHSGEDRRVKKAFQEGMRSGVYAEVAHEVIRASPEEVRANSRASSAKLRWAVRGEKQGGRQ